MMIDSHDIPGKPWLKIITTIDLMLISINLISSIKDMNPITRKSMSKLIMQPSLRAVGQTHAKR